MTSAATTVGSSVYLKIKSDIITGALTPGKKLKLDALKVQYSASVSTLRETLTGWLVMVLWTRPSNAVFWFVQCPTRT